jgi:hypothetical protein
MKELIMKNQNKKLSYRVWLLIFAIVFLLGLVGILGLRAIISSSSAMGELNTELSTVIQTGIIISVDVVLAVVAIILSIRTTLKSSTHKVWFLIIAVGFILNFVLGLIASIDAFNTLRLYEDFTYHKMDYYNVIGNSIIPLIYGALSVIAIILSRRFSSKREPQTFQTDTLPKIGRY